MVIASLTTYLERAGAIYSEWMDLLLLEQKKHKKKDEEWEERREMMKDRGLALSEINNFENRKREKSNFGFIWIMRKLNVIMTTMVTQMCLAC